MNTQKKRVKKKLVILEDEANAVHNTLNNLMEKFNVLNEKYEVLEHRMIEMTKLIHIANLNACSTTFKLDNMSNNGKKQERITDVLNKSTIQLNPTDFTDFQTIVSEMNETHLKIVFKNKYEDGYVFVLLDLLNIYEKKYNFKIVRAFNKQSNTLYIYNNTAWTIWTDTAIMAIINQIYKRIINEFAKWQKENLKQINEDDYLAIECSTQLIKIIGNPASKQNFCDILTKKLYKQLKSDL